ncbi:uncharacterized protein MYCFIDRAFT_211670 [Pseudocercospora fijiensis CIRAD86]|uniref:EthD domain-containing protein n=1 Tax=Pseudocercospora fijiensis (strain CIRAD86) TaxID=383855 RepID=M3AUJ6_PSEFD|nr:uncharacterized protein MYCFIDRAFT_211670 [Pseudocercospora fijiensis CIRAD86]EME80808.1 hypothetical protein MYCFIDRAFT_211670 [Pseudocercospora fijiensis CIRAD86]
MVLKILIFTNRLPTLTPAEFKNYYETHHMPLIQKISGDDAWLSHTRNYIPRDSDTNTAQLIIGDQDLEFDCVAEVIYRDQEQLQRQMAAVGTSENTRLREEDEERFIERRSVKVVVVESCGGSVGGFGG